MIADAQGNPVSGASGAAVTLFDQALRAFNLAYGNPMGGFEAAIAAAPDCAMARLARAWLFSMSRDPIMVARAREALDGITDLPMNDRERGHYAALILATTGRRTSAIGVLDRLLMSFPFDILAHQVALLSDLSIGRSRWMRDRVARALPQWDKARPGYAPLLSFHAFGLEENGDYVSAEAEGRTVAELEPNSYFAHHTVTHVMEMMGRPEDGIGWMGAREKFWSSNQHPNRDHIWWHKALYHLDLTQYDAALAIYDGSFLASEKALAVSLTHASALLWRLDTLGVDVAERWRALLHRWQGHADGRCLCFADLHAIMAELRSGQEVAAEQRLAIMRQSAVAEDEAASTYRDAGVPFAEGLIAFHRGNYAAAVEHMLPARFELYRIGGSHAQRDVFDWTLVEAAVRGGVRGVGKSLAHERLTLKPRSHVNQRFLRLAA